MTTYLPPDRVSAIQALRWWTGGLSFLMQAPIRLSIVALVPLAVEIAIQLVPVLGIVLSKLVTPIAVVLVYLAYDNFVSTRALDLSGARQRLASLGVDRLAGLSLISLLIYATQIIVGYAIYGRGVIDVAVLGDTAEHRAMLDSGFALTLILPGLVPGVLLMFFGLLVGLKRERAIAAAKASVVIMLRSPAALITTMLVTGALAAIAILWGYGVGLLFISIWATACGFVAYLDVFEGRSARAAKAVESNVGNAAP